VELGAAYSDAGADELVFLDVRATLEGRPALLALVARNGSFRCSTKRHSHRCDR
jgi:imidazole glycerol phosphate synthase subunit HisF